MIIKDRAHVNHPTRIRVDESGASAKLSRQACHGKLASIPESPDSYDSLAGR